MTQRFLTKAIALTALALCATLASTRPVCAQDDSAAMSGPTIFEGEKYIKNLRQLTFGGQNAEAYFSYDASELIFQATVGDHECDAIFRMNADGSNVRQISSGEGVTTCSFIAP
ncbi:MAG TPA: hypothetical protein VLB27_11150, partial [candidate division Zixibacteria bacterium]|nr:hypothetical protein [candidate division Zixibacteria bacterium]